MQQLIEEIQADIYWRITQLATIRTIPLKYSMTDAHKETIYWYSVPSIYAIWEGYIDNTFRLYIDYLNRRSLTSYNLDLNVLTHVIDIQCELNNKITKFEKKKEIVGQLFQIMNRPLEIQHALPKGSNIDFKVANNILARFNLPPLDNRFNSPLNRLRYFRNHIAHGENALIVEKKDIYSFTWLVEDLMYDILLKIDESIKNKEYEYIQ